MWTCRQSLQIEVLGAEPRGFASGRLCYAYEPLNVSLLSGQLNWPLDRRAALSGHPGDFFGSGSLSSRPHLFALRTATRAPRVDCGRIEEVLDMRSIVLLDNLDRGSAVFRNVVEVCPL